MSSPTKPRRRLTRILLVEDEQRRHTWFTSQLACIPDVHLVWAKTGIAAITLLKKDAPDTHSGLLLDHDLYTESAVLRSDGRRVVDTIIAKVDVATPALVHSANSQMAPVMENSLKGAGFDVTRIHFSELVAEPSRFIAWLEKVKDRRAELDEDAEEGA